MNTLRLFLSFALLTAISLFSHAQEEYPDGFYPLSPLSIEDEALLLSLPELNMPSGYASRDLPAVVDNSTQPFMRPAYQQDGLSCGQASMIGYNFTYEMSRERDLNASLIQNQYPTHFAWNFMNGGSGYFGVSYLHSIQILKEFGMPNVVDYGGAMGYGGSSRWMSGYDQYYNSMHNRITNAYQLQVGSPEGLMVLKNWLHNHLEDSDAGGIASFYAQHMSATQMLPAGTPEAGKYVLTSFGGSPNHAMTIVGYNDSIRWDYNSDGQYTNHLDINNDGAVNMKDWEIGGFKMVQSYGGVPNWGNQGYAYMMYKTVADNLGSGGIWNHCVHLLDVKETCDPKLTARITLKHTRRDRIKVLAGIANNINASTPEITLGFPIYDFHGGNRYMQGGTTEADKTIEFGLDISKLLSHININQNVKVFLLIVEQDADNIYPGEVIHFSIYDHTGEGTQIICPQTNVPLANNDTTTLSLTHLFDFNRVNILDEYLPPAPEGQYFSHQLTATGGSEPYIWEFDKKYPESIQTAAFPLITAVQLTPSNNSNGKVTQAIGFDFPFFDTAFSSITVYVDGYLMFDGQLYPYPYFIDDKVLFNVSRNISPFMNQHQEINYSQGCGIWYEGDENSATFRWKTSLSENPAKQFNYAVKIYTDGTIKFFYGPMDGCADYLWISGISNGDNYNNQTTSVSNKPAVIANSQITLQRYNYPPEMELDENGLFYGTPQLSYANEQITFKVIDNNFIHTTKTFTFTSTGLILVDSITAGGDGVIAFGEEALMSVKILNLLTESIPDANMTIHINDDYITVTDSTEYLGTLQPGVPNILLNAFQFDVSSNVPDNHLITIQTIISSEGETWESLLFHYAYAPVITSESVTVDDDNGRLDPGDSTDMTIRFVNYGGVEVSPLYSILTESDPFVIIHENFGNIPSLQPGQAADVTFNVSVSEDCPPGHEIHFLVMLTGNNNYSSTYPFNMPVGLFREDFESGDLYLFSWGSAGNRDWFIDTFAPQEGNFCVKSGPITHSEESILKIDMEVLFDGEISFYKRVYCEDDASAYNNYDYLAFLIDGIELGRWDSLSEWSWHSYPVTAGLHRFEWVYRKNNTVNFRMDAAWIDNIIFPSSYNASPELVATPGSFDFLLRPDETESVALQISNNAWGDLDFEAMISGRLPSSDFLRHSGRNIEGSNLVCNAEYFHTGKEYIWNFRTYNGGNDNEWLKEIFINFPQGFNLVEASNFIGGSGGDMVFMGPLGNGVNANWFGEDASGWGVVHLGENASCNVNINTISNVHQDLIISYEVLGEVYGGPPHVVSGNIPLRNFGPEIPWLDLDITSGQLFGNQSAEITLTVNPSGLIDGTYYAWVVLQDNYGHEIVIPVTLTVDQFIGIENPSMHPGKIRIEASPNPFTDHINFDISLPKPDKIKVDILNAQSIVILSETIDTGSSSDVRFLWDARDQSGLTLPSGIYMARFIAGNNIGFVKVMLLK